MLPAQKVLAMLAAISLASAAPGVVTQDIAADTEHRHQTRSPAQRKTPHHLDNMLRTANGLSKRWYQWEHASGDLGGLRPWLDEHGLVLDLTYTGEVFSNLHGGRDITDATAYRGRVIPWLTVQPDLQLILNPGGNGRNALVGGLRFSIDL